MSITKFDKNIHQEIGGYVYALIDPRDNKPFYIGKGHRDRVFDHAKGVGITNNYSEKYNTIREILDEDHKVGHVILRHGLSNSECLLVESVLIDFLKYNNINLKNLVAGHMASTFGVMTVEEVVRKYKAPPLNSIPNDTMVLNVNRRFKESKGAKTFYDITRGDWNIAKSRTETIKVALSEYQGFIVEVFKIQDWKEVSSENYKKTRWRFSGQVADKDIRSKFINKRIEKTKGAANPVRFNL